MHKYFDQIFSKYQCSFLQDYITQHCLLVIVEKRKEAIDKGSCLLLIVEKRKEAIDKDRLGEALLTNLSKVFSCIKHDVVIAKLATY